MDINNLNVNDLSDDDVIELYSDMVDDGDNDYLAGGFTETFTGEGQCKVTYACYYGTSDNLIMSCYYPDYSDTVTFKTYCKGDYGVYCDNFMTYVGTSGNVYCYSRLGYYWSSTSGYSGSNTSNTVYLKCGGQAFGSTGRAGWHIYSSK